MTYTVLLLACFNLFIQHRNPVHANEKVNIEFKDLWDAEFFFHFRLPGSYFECPIDKGLGLTKIEKKIDLQVGKMACHPEGKFRIRPVFRIKKITL